MATRVLARCALTRTSGARASTDGRRPPDEARNWSTIASLMRTAPKRVSRILSLTPVKSTASVSSTVEVARPVDRLRGLVELVAVGGRPARQRQQDAAGDPRPEAGAVCRLERAGERDAGADLLDVRRAEPAQLTGEQGLEAARDGREEGEVTHHARLPRRLRRPVLARGQRSHPPAPTACRRSRPGLESSTCPADVLLRPRVSLASRRRGRARVPPPAHPASSPSGSRCRASISVRRR